MKATDRDKCCCLGCRHPQDELPELYINQLQPSTLRWDAAGLNITLRSSTIADDGFAAMSLQFAVGGPAASFAFGAKSTAINLKVGLILYRFHEQSAYDQSCHCSLLFLDLTTVCMKLTLARRRRVTSRQPREG